MSRLPLAALTLSLLAPAAQAHEVWVERDATGPARIYLGEPADILPEGGDPEFEHLKSPSLVPASTAPQQRKAGWIEVAAPAGDVRVTDGSVFAPWGEDGKKEAIVYYARAGRTEANAGLPFEIVPAAPNAARFTLLRDGKPVPATKVTVVTPDKWQKGFTTDATGKVTLPLNEKGRYILSATHEEKGDLTHAGAKVTTLYHTTTLTFLNK